MDNARVSLWTELSSDAELIAGVRAGESAAFGVLFERHGSAARRVAGMYSAVPSDIDDIVSEAFAKVLKALQQGDGPDMAFRAYLFTVVRRTGLDMIAKGKRTRPDEDMTAHDKAIGYEKPSDEPALDNFEQSVVADAFRSLPERWQVVLWYTEIEKKSPAEVAPILGLSPNGVAALAYRAREALRQAYLQQHLATTDNVECLAVSENLAAFVRGGLTKREHAKVEAHVNACVRCTALIGELEDVNRGLRAVIAPLILGLLGVGALETSLPIGSASAVHLGTGASGAGASGAGAGASAATGGAVGGVAGAAGAGTALGLGGLLVRVAGGAQGGTSASPAVSGFLANVLGSGPGLLTGVAATVGVAALAVASAGIVGTLGLRAETHASSDPAGTIEFVAEATPHLETPRLPVYLPDAPGSPNLGPANQDAGSTPSDEAGTGSTGNTGGTTDPGPVDPGPVDPGPVDPGPVDPGPVDPGPVDPGPVDPGPVDPGPVDPGPVDPGPVDPGPVDPGPVDPGTGNSVVLTGSRVSVSIPDGGTFHISESQPQVSMTVTNTTGMGSTPVSIYLDLPDGLSFVATNGGLGRATTNSADWTCAGGFDISVSLCVTSSLPGGAVRTLTLPVTIAGVVASGATTTLVGTTVIDLSLDGVAIPTIIDADPGTGDPGTGDPGTGDPGTGDPGTGDPGTGDPGTGDPGTGDPGTGDPGTGDPGTGDPGTGDPGTGADSVVISGERVVITVAEGGTFYLDLPTPVVHILASNPSGQGSTPITVVIELPAGAQFATSTDKHGNLTLAVDDPWNCDVSSDATEATCTSPSLPGGQERNLNLAVVLTATLADDAATTVTVSTPHEDLPPADIPTVVRPEDLGDAVEPADDDDSGDDSGD